MGQPLHSIDLVNRRFDRGERGHCGIHTPLRILSFSLFLLALLLLAMPHQSFAGSVTWPTDAEVLSLGPHLEYLVDPTGTLELRDAQTSVDAWASVGEETASFGYTSDVYWFRTTLPATAPDASSAFLHIGYPLLDQVDFFELDASSTSPKRTISVGDRKSFNERPHSHRHFLFDVTPSNTAREIYFRVKTTRSMNVPLTISTQATFHTNDDALTMAFGLLFGGMLLMILYNVILYGWTRDTNYLMYCGYAGCLVVFFAAFQGFGFQYLWPRSIFWQEASMVVTISAVVATAMSFNLGFLNIQQELPKLYPLGKTLIALACLTMGSGFILEYSVAILLAFAVLLPACTFAMGTGVYLLKRGFRPARYYVVSWAAVLIGAVLLVLNRAGFLPVNILTDNILLVGATAQLMLLSYALADRINQMKEDKERIQRQALEDQRHAAAELRAALDQAEEASRLKSEFLANISHELRTPLNAIVNLPSGMLSDFDQTPTWSCQSCGAEFQAEDSSGEEPPADYQPDCPECGHPLKHQVEPTFIGKATDQVHFLKRIETSGRHLLGVVNDLLDISKLEAERMQIYPEPFQVFEMLQEVADSLESLAQAKSISLHFPDERLDWTLDADRIKVAQILVNLIGNAIKFTPEKGEIYIRVKPTRLCDEDALGFEVQDTGIGIPKEALDLIFDSFRQVDGSHTRQHQGTGLGLAITQRLVLLHKGTIDVTSEVGSGSTFRFVLPLVQLREERPQPNEESRNHA